jgi:predicted alternative tryptophan synthase beta-subunit
MPSDKTRFGLDELHIPEQWYNIIPDLKNPPVCSRTTDSRRRSKSNGTSSVLR